MKTVKRILPALVAVLLVPPAFAQGGASLKIWNADFTVNGQDAGDGPMAYLAYVLEDAAGDLVLEAGYGSADGSGLDVTRSDLGISFLTPPGPARFGAGGRFITQDINDSTVRYIGPELLADLHLPVEELPVTPFVSGTVGVYMYDASFDGAPDKDGTVLGYALSLGLATTLDDVALEAGYRLQELDGDGSSLGSDELSGFFLKAAFSW